MDIREQSVQEEQDALLEAELGDDNAVYVDDDIQDIADKIAKELGWV